MRGKSNPHSESWLHVFQFHLYCTATGMLTSIINPLLVGQITLCIVEAMSLEMVFGGV